MCQDAAGGVQDFSAENVKTLASACLLQLCSSRLFQIQEPTLGASLGSIGRGVRLASSVVIRHKVPQDVQKRLSSTLGRQVRLDISECFRCGERCSLMNGCATGLLDSSKPEPSQRTPKTVLWSTNQAATVPSAPFSSPNASPAS